MITLRGCYACCRWAYSDPWGTAPRDVAVFGRVLDLTKLGPIERFVMNKMQAVPGDYRDWEAIEAWARTIAQALQATA